MHLRFTWVLFSKKKTAYDIKVSYMHYVFAPSCASCPFFGVNVSYHSAWYWTFNPSCRESPPDSLQLFICCKHPQKMLYAYLCSIFMELHKIPLLTRRKICRKRQTQSLVKSERKWRRQVKHCSWLRASGNCETFGQIGWRDRVGVLDFKEWFFVCFLNSL